MSESIHRSIVIMLITIMIFPAGSGAADSESSTWKKTFGGKQMDYGRSISRTSDGGYVMIGGTWSFGTGGDILLVKTDGDGNRQWMKNYGGRDTDAGLCVIQTSDGGYALCGWTDSYRPGASGCILIKTDASGNQQWFKTYYGPREKENSANCLIQTADGGYLLAGDTSAGGVPGYDICLIRVDDRGILKWRKTYGSKYHDEAYSVVAASDGCYAVCGVIGTSDPNNSDVYLFTVDGKGTKLWEKTYGGDRDDIAYGLSRTSDGGFVITGRTHSFGAWGNDAFLIRTDSGGKQEWLKTYGGRGNEFGMSVFETSGGYVIGGETDTDTAGSYDLMLIRVDRQGALLWEKKYGGPNLEGGGYAVPARNGGIVLFGSTHSYGAGMQDLWIIKTDDGGNVR